MSYSDDSINQRISEKPISKSETKEELKEKIKNYYSAQTSSQVVKADVKNIVIIGRSRTGKSTIKEMLVNPMEAPKDLDLISCTREPTVESFFISGKNLILNIIDTPGVFERQTTKELLRDNETIFKTIETCINLEITKFHSICFAFSMTAGIQSDDMEALKLFIKKLGSELSQNSCLIITRCESKTEDQRKKIRENLLKDSEFQEIKDYFQRGIFFTGSMNYDDYQAGNSSVLGQFTTVVEYRNALLDEFSKKCEPFQINQSYISDIRRIQEKYNQKIQELQSQMQMSNMNEAQQRNEIERLQKEAEESRRNAAANSKGCSIS